MSLFIAQDVKRGIIPIAGRAGTVMRAVFTHTFTANFDASADILEIGVFPAHVQIVRAALVSGAGMAASQTADVGFMSGKPGEDDATRTLDGTELFAAADAVNTEAEMTNAGALAVTREETHRGIGIELSQDVTAGPTATLTLVVEYVY